MRKVNELTIDDLEEVSGVDNPAQPGALAVIFKRDFSAEERARLADSGAALPDGSFPIATVEDLRNAVQAIGRASDREKAIAHIRRRAVVLGASELVPESFGKNTPGDPGRPEENEMTDKTPAEKELEAVQKRLADAEQALVIAKAIGEFSDAERALYAGMDEAGQSAFRKLTPVQRQERVRAVGESNPVVYTTLDGEAFRKNDDPRLVAIAKRADEDRKALLSERTARRAEEFKKCASAELKHMPGTEIVKVAVLRVIETIEDAETKAGALALLKAGNDALAKSFEERGTSAGDDDSDGHDKLSKIAKGLREKNPKLSEWDAYALAADQNPELYAEALGAQE